TEIALRREEREVRIRRATFGHVVNGGRQPLRHTVTDQPFCPLWIRRQRLREVADEGIAGIELRKILERNACRDRLRSGCRRNTPALCTLCTDDGGPIGRFNMR